MSNRSESSNTNSQKSSNHSPDTKHCGRAREPKQITRTSTPAIPSKLNLSVSSVSTNRPRVNNDRPLNRKETLHSSMGPPRTVTTDSPSRSYPDGDPFNLGNLGSVPTDSPFRLPDATMDYARYDPDIPQKNIGRPTSDKSGVGFGVNKYPTPASIVDPLLPADRVTYPSEQYTVPVNNGWGKPPVIPKPSTSHTLPVTTTYSTIPDPVVTRLKRSESSTSHSQQTTRDLNPIHHRSTSDPNQSNLVTYSTPCRDPVDFSDLSSSVVKPSPEVTLRVSRDNYKEVHRVYSGTSRGHVIVGPTGCGKSTIALLGLITPGKKVLLVEPTESNAANIVHEFRNNLPALVARGYVKEKIPPVTFVSPTYTPDLPVGLSVTSVEKLRRYFTRTSKLPKVDVIVVDEFHLAVPDMVYCLVLVRVMRSVTKYVLVSATPIGVDASKCMQLPSGVSKFKVDITIAQDTPLQDTYTDPRKYAEQRAGNYAIVCHSLSAAKHYHTIYKSWGVRSHLISRDTKLSDYLFAVSDYRAQQVVYVLEPAVEAGVTLPISTLVSLGATTAVRYDGDVVLESLSSLSADAEIQRGSRGGRVYATHYYVPRTRLHGANQTLSCEYYTALVCVDLAARKIDLASLVPPSWLSSFPKILNLTHSQAMAAVVGQGDQFVESYRHNSAGVLYKECGGNGSGFDKIVGDLKIYYWAGGFFIAPIVDFTASETDPSTFVLRQHQIEAAKTLANQMGLFTRFSFEELLNLTVVKLDHYIDDLYDCMNGLLSPTQEAFLTMSKKDVYPELINVLNDEVLVKFVESLSTHSAISMEVRDKKSTHGRSWSLRFPKGTLHLSFTDEVRENGKISPALVADQLTNRLRGIMAVEIIKREMPDKTVSLEKYVDKVPTSHVWFNKNIARGADSKNL